MRDRDDRERRRDREGSGVAGFVTAVVTTAALAACGAKIYNSSKAKDRNMVLKDLAELKNLKDSMDYNLGLEKVAELKAVALGKQLQKRLELVIIEAEEYLRKLDHGYGFFKDCYGSKFFREYIRFSNKNVLTIKIMIRTWKEEVQKEVDQLA